MKVRDIESALMGDDMTRAERRAARNESKQQRAQIQREDMEERRRDRWVDDYLARTEDPDPID